MAVTQNLARLTVAHLAECAASLDELDAVCSFTALDQTDYLDLDWAPFLLWLVAEGSGASPALASALRRATEGEGEVNPTYRDRPHSVWEHPVTCLDAAHVAEVQVGLEQLAEVPLLSPQRVLSPCAALPPSQVPDQAFAYLKRHFDALRAFYADAARQSLAIICWQD